MLRRYWGLVLAVCMATFGIGWLVIGFSPVYPLLLLGMALVAMAASIWHLPVMGHLSDRFGRKLVLIPGMLFLRVMTVLLVPYGQGIVLLVILALLGTFLFSDQPILTAAALDLVGEGVAAITTTTKSINNTNYESLIYGD